MSPGYGPSQPADASHKGDPVAMADYKLFINGESVEAQSGETFATYDPGTGEKIADVAKGGTEDAEAAIEAARKAFDEGPWPKMSGKERSEKLLAFAGAVADNAEELAELEARDSGGTIRKAQMADLTVTQASIEWFAKMAAERPDREELPGSPFPVSENYLRHEPIGVCTGITPWNFPLVMAAWKIAPALAAGNTSVIKPASLTSLTTIRLVEIANEAADLPPGVLNVVPGPGGTVGETLAAHPKVDKVAFTGSTEVGSRIMQVAAAGVKPVTLELGGKSANIVLDDADLDTAAASVLWGTFFHGGQVCQSGTRALVQQSIYDEFINLLAERANKISIGSQMDPMTDLGPLVDHGQVKTVERYVASGREEVGEPICGGAKPDVGDGLDPDSFYEPTIFADVDNGAKIAQEEIFGPVLSVIPFETDDDAIAIANDSIYGLGGGVQSGNLERAGSVADRMQTGTVWINDYHMLSPERPFGGYKQSGIGRELGWEGYEVYRQTKHVYVNPNADRENHFHYAVLSGEI